MTTPTTSEQANSLEVIAKIKAFFNRIVYEGNDKSKPIVRDEPYDSFIESMSIVKDMKFYITLETGEVLNDACQDACRYKYCAPKYIYTEDEISEIYKHPDALLLKNVNFRVKICGGVIDEFMDAREIQTRFPAILHFIDPNKAKIYKEFAELGIIKDKYY